MEPKYYTDRSGLELKVDKKDIESDCNVITFVCNGDWPVYIRSNGVKRYLEQFQEVSFGSDLPEIIEVNKFSIEFDPDGFGTKSVFVERAKYRPFKVPGKC